EQLPLVGSADLLLGSMGDTGVTVMGIACPGLYHRAGGPYADNGGREWEDNALRFGILSRIAALLACHDSPLTAWRPQIVHCNDWQSGLTPAYMHFMPDAAAAKSLISVHSLAFQGSFPPDWVQRLWLPPHSYQMHGVEYHGQLSFLKAGLYYADAISTVSPTYAHEIRTSELGFGMEGLLANLQHHLQGILNGIDLQEWNPATDPYLAANYDAGRLHDKQQVKADLQ